MQASNISKTLLQLLKSADNYLSGEQMAKKLNISRAAVWKRIDKLRKKGFSIDAQPRSGYRLQTMPDILTPEEIKEELDTSIFGQKVFYYRVTESTNLIAKKLAMDGAAEGSIVVAEEQTKGRGRLNREWLSPSCKNILMSIIFSPDIQPSRVFSITMLTAVAIVKAIEKTTGLKAMIKWPNDIFIGMKKTGGILTEFNAQQDFVSFVVTGVGLNVNFDPLLYPEISDISTSLSNELGNEVSRVVLLKTILKEIEKGYLLLKEGKLSQIHNQWNSYSLVTGRHVKITSFNTVEEGIAEYVDIDGSLNLRDKQGNIKKIVCGDVSLRF